MMKTTCFFLFLILTINLLIFMPSGLSDSLLVDWDDESIGSESGTSGFIQYLSMNSGTDFIIENEYVYSSPLDLSIHDSSDGGIETGYLNLTDDYDYMASIKIYFDAYFISTPLAHGSSCFLHFYNESGEVLKIEFISYSQQRDIKIYDTINNDHEVFSTASDGNQIGYLLITHINSNLMNYSYYNLADELQGSIEESSKFSATWTSFDYIYVEGVKYSSPDGSKHLKLNIDDIAINIAEESIEEGTIHIKLVDLETGKPLYAGGLGTPKAWMLESDKIPNVRLDIRSDLLGGFSYDPPALWGHTIDITDLDFTNGEYHYLNLTSISGFVTLDFEVKHYYDSTNYFQFYDGQIYTIYVTDSVSDYGGFSNCQESVVGGLTTELCSDKQFYTQGESINFRYKVPHENDLYKIWWLPSDYYYLWLYDTNNLHWLFGTTDEGKSADNWGYIENYAIVLNNVYQTLQWKYNATGESGYKTVTGGRDTYKAYIGHGGGQLFGADTILSHPYGLLFHITSGIFTPQGNITSISPESPELGQRTQIAFEVNNGGHITVRNLLSPDENEDEVSGVFAKFDGIRFVNYTFWEYGEYLLTLYVTDGLGYQNVDTYNLSVKTLNGTYGGFGYNIEYLTTEPARAIAGFDTVYINYRCLKENGNITVIDSRGQQTPFSSTVGIKTGVLNIQLPNYAEIGKWNITLNGNVTLYSSFNVVAHENNWVEFAKNIFYDDEPFLIELKHDRKIKVIFYKDSIAYGRDWFLEVGLLSSGIFPVPMDIAFPEIGEWKVQIVEVNDFIKKQLLAEDTCKVIDRPFDAKIVVDDDIAGYLTNIDPFYKGLIGIFIVLLCTFMPFIAIKKLGEHGVNFKVDIPPMLYTICCGVGAVVALILGVWVVEYTFFICVMAGFGTFALYLMGKRNGSE